MPSSTVPLVVGYVPGRTERARIAGALRGRARVQWAESMAELRSAVRRHRGPIAAVFLAPRDATGATAGPVVRDLATVAPNVPVIAYCRTGIEHSRDIRALAAAGVHEFLFVGVDDAGAAVRTVLASAQRACAVEAVLAALRPRIPESLHPLAEYGVAHPDHARSVAAIAAMLGVHRKTLFNHCRRAGAPAPAELLTWCRLLLAAHMLATTASTVEAVAMDLEFPSDTALRNTMKRYTGQRASDVRRRGGLSYVLGEFSNRLKETSSRLADAPGN